MTAEEVLEQFELGAIYGDFCWKVRNEYEEFDKKVTAIENMAVDIADALNEKKCTEKDIKKFQRDFKKAINGLKDFVYENGKNIIGYGALDATDFSIRIGDASNHYKANYHAFYDKIDELADEEEIEENEKKADKVVDVIKPVEEVKKPAEEKKDVEVNKPAEEKKVEEVNKPAEEKKVEEVNKSAEENKIEEVNSDKIIPTQNENNLINEENVNPNNVSNLINEDNTNQNENLYNETVAKYNEEKASTNTIGVFTKFYDRLELCKTKRNSREYNELIDMVNMVNKTDRLRDAGNLTNKQQYALKLYAIKNKINKYIGHKAQHGVNKNVGGKLAAVEALNVFVSDKLKEISDLDPFTVNNKEYNLKKRAITVKQEMKVAHKANPNATLPADLGRDDLNDACMRRIITKAIEKGYSNRWINKLNNAREAFANNEVPQPQNLPAL